MKLRPNQNTCDSPLGLDPPVEKRCLTVFAVFQQNKQLFCSNTANKYIHTDAQSWWLPSRWSWSRSCCRCNQRSTVTSSSTWPNWQTTSRLGHNYRTAAAWCLSLTALRWRQPREEATLLVNLPPGADGSSQHPVADWRILRARPQDRPRCAEEDGQVVHQRRRHRQTADHQSGRQALSHQLQAGVKAAAFACRRIRKIRTVRLVSDSLSFFSPQTKLLTQYVLNLAKYDQNYDIRDRARFIRQLIVPTEKSGALSKYAKKLFLALKPAPVLESPFKGTGSRSKSLIHTCLIWLIY